MTISNLTSTLAVYATEFKSVPGGVVDQINRGVTLSKILQWKAPMQADIGFVAKGSGATAVKNTEGGAISAGAPNVRKTARLDWALYDSAFGVTDLAASKAAMSSSPEAEKNTWMVEMGDHMVWLAKTLEQKLFTATGGTQEVAGLALAIDDTLAYAGIDPAVDTFWKSSVFSTAASLDFNLIRSDKTTIAKASGEFPDVAVCDLDTLDKLNAMFDNSKVYQYDVSIPNVGKVNLEGGGGRVTFDGMSFVGAVDCPANTIYYLNSKHIHVEYLLPPDWLVLMNRVNAAFASRGMASVGSAIGPFQFYLKEIPLAAHARQAAVVSQCQLVLDKRNAFGVRKNIA